MFGEKIGKQKIYISAINGPSLPPNPLKTGVGPSVVQSCHSLSLLFGGKRKIEKYLFPSSRALHCPPNPLKEGEMASFVQLNSCLKKERKERNVKTENPKRLYTHSLVQAFFFSFPFLLFGVLCF